MSKNTFPHLVFVYGTLMSPHGNNSVMTGHKNKDAELIGEATTLQKFYMASGGFPRVAKQVIGSLPVSESKTSYLAQVKGELWRINDAALKACDRLEGHPRFYCREEVPVTTLDSKRTRYRAWMYVIVEPFHASSAMQRNVGGVLEWGPKETLKW